MRDTGDSGPAGSTNSIKESAALAPFKNVTRTFCSGSKMMFPSQVAARERAKDSALSSIDASTNPMW
jgi:hypothetical protein